MQFDDTGLVDIYEGDVFVFNDLCPFLAVYNGPLNIYDIDTGSLLYRSTTDGNVPGEYVDCEVSHTCIEGGALAVYIAYSFHAIDDEEEYDAGFDADAYDDDDLNGDW